MIKKTMMLTLFTLFTSQAVANNEWLPETLKEKAGFLGGSLVSTVLLSEGLKHAMGFFACLDDKPQGEICSDSGLNAMKYCFASSVVLVSTVAFVANMIHDRRSNNYKRWGESNF